MNNLTDARITAALEEIDRLYMLGANGDKQAVVEADAKLTELRNKNPSHPLAKAYHGGVKILIARDRKKPMEKLRFSRAGLKLLDEAAAAAPSEPIIRIIRGRCSYQLPEKYFARTKTAIEDYTFLLEQLRRGTLTMKTEEAETMQYELGDAYYRIGKYENAYAEWTRLLNRTRNPKMREQVLRRLPEAEGKKNLADPPEGAVSPSALLVAAAVRQTESMLTDWIRRTEKERRKKSRKKKKK